MATKRSLFKRPAWASSSTHKPIDDRSSIFSNDVYDDIVDAERRKANRRAHREKKENEKTVRKERSASADTKVVDEKVVKKQRLSLEDEGDIPIEQGSNDDEGGSETSGNESSSTSSGVSQNKRGVVLRSTSKSQEMLAAGLGSERKSKSSPEKSKTIIISIDDEDEDEDEDDNGDDGETRIDRPEMNSQANQSQQTKPSQGSKPKRRPSHSDSEEDEDEYLRELKRKARKTARLNKLGLSTESQVTPSSGGVQPSSDSRSPTVPPALHASIDLVDPTRQARATSTPNPDDDPEVQISIKTIIPDAKPLIVVRRASQPLEKVKIYWCQRNGFSQALTDKVFFTWTGSRLYNSTTMRSILAMIKKKHGTRKDGGDLANGRIEIEAVTEEIFEHRLNQKKQLEAAARDNPDEMPETPRDGSVGTAADGENAASANAPPTENGALIVKLSSARIGLINLRVRPNTTAQKIISGYRKLVKIIPPEQECWLVFDGERMDGDATVEEMGFEHDDTIEVHIKQT